MKDIFDATISCNCCKVEMQPERVMKQGFSLRAVQCPKCKDKIVHPGDLHKLEKYSDMKQKTFNVKLRVVGNSHAVSIPKEIVDFMHENHRRMKQHMNTMVKLCFEDFGKLSLDFFGEGDSRKRTRKQGFSFTKSSRNEEDSSW